MSRTVERRSVAKIPTREGTEVYAGATLRRWPAYMWFGLVTLIVLSSALIRFRLRDMPLERDEGEYAYVGQLMLQGIPPYQEAYAMKLPGTYAAYAVLMAVFGQTPAGIHLGLILVNTATIMLVFLLARRLFGNLAGVVACATYALLSTSESVLGLAAHATHFVVLPALAGILILLWAIESRKWWLYFVSGLILGLAFLMKQPGIFFVLFAGLYLLKSEAKKPLDHRGLARRAGVFSAGAILPFTLTCLWLLRAGLLGKFWFWTFVYASQYASSNSVMAAIPVLELVGPGVVSASVFVWIVAALGLTALFWDRESRPHAGFVLAFLLFSFLAVCPGFYFRGHYFILMLPAVAVLAGLAVSSGTRKAREMGINALAFAPVLVFLAAAAYSVMKQRQFLFVDDPMTATRAVYAPSPFSEAPQIAEYILAHSSPQARIAVLGSEPQIYFYAHRRSASGYIYMYELMEEQKFAAKMQQDAIHEIEAAQPEYIVNVNVFFSWFPRPNSDRAIFQWARTYIQQHYELIGLVDLQPQGSEFRWDDAARAHSLRSSNFVEVFRRK
jgi:Dolichyl-phosphate-mannose-protein mannosyltransferase